jgi:hypothetical protein
VLLEVDLEQVKILADQIGKTNTRFNQYAAILKKCDVYRENGLDPVVFSDYSGTQIIVSCRQLQEGKFH